MRAWLVSLGFLLVISTYGCGSSESERLNPAINSDADTALSLPHEIGTETGNVATRIILALSALYNDVEIQNSQLRIQGGRLGCKTTIDNSLLPVDARVLTELWLVSPNLTSNSVLTSTLGTSLSTEIIPLHLPDHSQIFCRSVVVREQEILDQAQTDPITLNYQQIFLAPGGSAQGATQLR